MAEKDNWISKLRRVVDRERPPAPAAEPSSDGTTGPAEPDVIARDVFGGTSGEYADLLSELGAEAPAGDAADRAALKDAAISELTANLANLRPLGDRFAEAERGRLAAVERAASLESDRERLRERVAELEGRAQEAAEAKQALNVEKRQRGAAEYRLRKLREKLEAEHQLAVERWRELKAVRGERRRLEQTLKRERKHLDAVKSLVDSLAPNEPKAARLAELMADEATSRRAGRARRGAQA